MKSQVLKELGGQRTFILVFDPEEELMGRLADFVEENHTRAAQFTGIGAFRALTVGWFDIEKRDYCKIPITEQVEVLSLAGNISRYEGKPRVHAHVVVGKRDGTAHGGHLLEGWVMPTLELVVFEFPASLERRFSPEIGFALLNVGECQSNLPNKEPS
jgi:uncharacterized protein